MLSPVRPTAPTLLEQHPVFISHDIDDARAQVGRIFCPHDLQQLHSQQRLDCRLHHIALGELSLNYLCYGADVEIVPGALDDFYLVQIPLSGQAHIQYGQQHTLSDARTAVILSPHQPVHMRWQGDCAQVLLHIPRRLMEQYAAQTLGDASTGQNQREPYRLDYQLSLAQHSGATASWCQMLLDLVRNIDQHGSTWLQHSGAAQSMQDFLLRSLLNLQPHNLQPHDRSTSGQRRQESALPRHIQRAQDFIHAQAEQSISVADIAQAACISVRALEEGFRRHLGSSPNSYLRDLRLDLVQQRLSQGRTQGAPVASVLEVAQQFGFFHMGRFAGYYKQRFGESPSTTLSAKARLHKG